MDILNYVIFAALIFSALSMVVLFRLRKLRPDLFIWRKAPVTGR